MHGEVKVSYDPKFFTWKRKQERGVRGEMYFLLHPSGQLRISAAATEKLREHLRPGSDGYYRVEIGIAQKAIAVRPVQDIGLAEGFRARDAGKGKSLYISCKKLLLDTGWELPVKVPVLWDEKNKMLAGKVEQG